MEYKLIDLEAESKERARIEVKEVTTVERVFTTTKETLLLTIQTLQARKAKQIAEIDAEIAYNEAMLGEIEKKIQNVVVSKEK